MSLRNLSDTTPDRDHLLVLDAVIKELHLLKKSILSYEQLQNAFKSTFQRLETEAEAEGWEADVCHFQGDIHKIEVDRFDSRIRWVQFAHDQGLQAHEELLSHTCYGKFKYGDLFAVEKTSQLMAERLRQQEAVIKSRLCLIAAQHSNSMSWKFLPTLVDIMLETEGDIMNGITSALKRIENTRREARLAHALRWRVAARELSILDLPNEILLSIIDYVRRKPVPICPSCDRRHFPRAASRASWDTASIQNLRLVCRDLYNLSSQFLLAAV